MADGFDRIARIRGGQQAPQTSNDAQFEAYRAAVNAANQASQQQGPPQGWRQANALERGLHWGGQFGESLGDIFGSREAWEEVKQARQDGSGLFGSVLNWLPRFAADLPGNMLGIPFMAPEKLGEVISGSPMQEIQNGYMPDYTLDTEQRLATLGDVGIDLLGLAFGGSRTALRTGRNMMRGMGNETLLDAATSTPRWQNGLSTPRRIAWDVTEEAGEEFAQQYLQEIRGDQEKHGVEALDDQSLDRALEGAFLGALGGGIFSGGSLAIEKGLGYAGDRAKKWANQNQSADEKVAMDIRTPYIKGDPAQDSRRDVDFVSKEYLDKEKDLIAREAKEPGVANVKFGAVAANWGKASHVPMAGFYRAANAAGESGLRVQEDLFDAFHVDEAAAAGGLTNPMFNITDAESARNTIRSLFATGRYEDAHSIFQLALKWSRDNGKQVKLAVFKQPHHNKGIFVLPVDSIVYTGMLWVDPAMQSKLNADSDSDNAVITFLRNYLSDSKNRIGGLYVKDELDTPYVAFEQFGLHTISSDDLNGMRDPVKIVDDLIKRHDDKAKADVATIAGGTNASGELNAPTGRLREFTNEQKRMMGEQARAMRDALISHDEHTFAIALDKLISIMGSNDRNDGTSAYNRDANQDMSDEANMLLLDDISSIMDRITFDENVFSNLFPSEDDIDKLDKKADEETSKLAESMVDEKVERIEGQHKIEIIKQARSYIDAPFRVIYRLLQGFQLDLRDPLINQIFRAVFEETNMRHSPYVEPRLWGNLIEGLALLNMQIQYKGQEKIDQVNSVFNNAVMVEVARRCAFGDRPFVPNFSSDMDWERFESVFKEVYNDFADKYNKSAEPVLSAGGKEIPQADKDAFLKQKVSDSGTFNIYDAMISVYGDSFQDTNSFTGGLTINEFLAYRRPNSLSISSFSDTMLSPEASQGDKIAFDKLIGGLISSWDRKRSSIYGPNGSIANYLASFGSLELSEHRREFADASRSGRSLNWRSGERSAFLEESANMLSAVFSVVDPTEFAYEQTHGIVKTGMDFIDQEEFSKLFMEHPGNDMGKDKLGWKRLGFLASLHMQSKFREEMSAINSAKKIIRDADLSDLESRRQAISDAKEFVNCAIVKLAAKSGFNSVHNMLFHDLVHRATLLDLIDDSTSATAVSWAFNELDKTIWNILDTSVDLDDKIELFDHTAIRDGRQHQWVADMLAPSKEIAGDLGIGNRLRKAKSYYSTDNGRVLTQYLSDVNSASEFRNLLDSSDQNSAFSRDTCLQMMRHACEKAYYEDPSIMAAAVMDVDILAIAAGEKAKSMPGSAAMSQYQNYRDETFHTSYYNQQTSGMNEVSELTVGNAFNTTSTMIKLVFGPASETAAKRDVWMIGDPLHRKKFVKYDSKKFYSVMLPHRIDRIKEIEAKKGWFAPDADLFIELITERPDIIAAISPKRYELAVNDDGQLMTGVNPKYKNIMELAFDARRVAEGVDDWSDRAIVWSNISGANSMNWVLQSAISLEDRAKRPSERSAIVEGRITEIRDLHVDTVLYMAKLDENGAEKLLKEYKDDLKRQAMKRAVDMAYKDMRDEALIDRSLEIAAGNVLSNLVTNIISFVAFENDIEEAYFDEALGKTSLDLSDMEWGDVINAIDAAGEKWIQDNISSITSHILSSVSQKLMLQWGLDQWRYRFLEVNDLNTESFNDRIKDHNLRNAISDSLEKAFRQSGKTLTKQQIEELMNTKFVRKFSDKIMGDFLNGISTAAADIALNGNESTDSGDFHPGTTTDEFSDFIDDRYDDIASNSHGVTKEFFKGVLDSVNSHFKSWIQINYDQLSDEFRDDVSRYEQLVIRWKSEKDDIAAGEIFWQVKEAEKDLVNKFNYEIPAFIINMYAPMFNIQQISTSTVWYSQKILEHIDSMYDTFKSNVTEDEMGRLRNHRNWNSYEKREWDVPLHMFDIVSQTEGATGFNYWARGSSEIRTGVEGNFPKYYNSFGFLRYAPQNIVLNDCQWSDLAKFALRDPSNEDLIASKSLGPADFYDVWVELDDDLYAFFNEEKEIGVTSRRDNTSPRIAAPIPETDSTRDKIVDLNSGETVFERPDRKMPSLEKYTYRREIVQTNKFSSHVRKGRNGMNVVSPDLVKLSADDIMRISGESFRSNFIIADGNAAEKLSIGSSYSNEERIIRIPKAPFSISNVAGPDAPNGQDLIKSLEIDFRKTDKGIRNDVLLAEWNSYIQDYCNKVVAYNRSSDSDTKSPLILDRLVMRYFVPCAEISIDKAFAEQNGLDSTIIVSYEQVHMASARLSMGRFDSLDDDELVSEPFKLKVRNIDRNVVEIPPEVMLSAMVKVQSADTVSLRLTKIAYDLSEEYADMSEDQQSQWKGMNQYIRDNFASRYIDWSNESFSELTADDWARVTKLPSGRSVPSDAALRTTARWLKFQDQLHDLGTPEIRKEMFSKTNDKSPAKWNMPAIEKFQKDPEVDNTLFSALTVIKKEPRGDSIELPRNVAQSYKINLNTFYHNSVISESEMSRSIVVNGNEFLDPKYEVPWKTDVILDYWPGNDRFKEILYKCLGSDSDIIFGEEIKGHVDSFLINLGYGYSSVQSEYWPKHPKIGGAEYGYRIRMENVESAIISSPSAVDPGMIEIQNYDDMDSGSKSKYLAADQPRGFYVVPSSKNIFRNLDSSILMTFRMARYIPSFTVEKNPIFNVNRSDQLGTVLMDSSQDDREALCDAIASEIKRPNGSIDYTKMSFEANGKKYHLNMSGMEKLKFDESVALDMVVAYAGKCEAERMIIKQGEVCTIAKSVSPDGEITLYPIAATDSIPHTSMLHETNGIEYRLDSIKLRIYSKFDVLDNVRTRDDWNKLVETNPKFIKGFNLKAESKGMIEAVKGEISISGGNGKEIPVRQVLDPINLFDKKVPPGVMRNRTYMMSLLDLVTKTSGHESVGSMPKGCTTELKSWVTIDKLPSTITEGSWIGMLTSKFSTSFNKRNWQKLLFESPGVHFIKSGEEWTGSEEQERFDSVTRMLITSMLWAGINPSVIMNPTNPDGDWVGKDSWFMDHMFNLTSSLDQLFFWSNYITRTDERRDGQIFCVPSSDMLFPERFEDYKADAELSKYRIDGECSAFMTCSDFQGVNGKEKVRILSGPIRYDEPASDLGSISSRSSVNDQMKMATWWVSGDGNIGEFAHKLYNNAEGMSRADSIGLLSKYVNTDLEDIDSDGAVTSTDVDMGWSIPKGAHPINLFDYIPPDTVKLPYVPTRGFVPKAMRNKLVQYEGMANLYRAIPAVYVPYETEEDMDKVQSLDDLKRNYLNRLRSALNAEDSVTDHQLCLLVMFNMGWTPRRDTTKGWGMDAINPSDFQDTVEYMIQKANTENGNIFDPRIFLSSGNGRRYSLGIGTIEIADILSRCSNAYKKYNNMKQSDKRDAIFDEHICSNDALKYAEDQLSVLKSEMKSTDKAQYEALNNFITFIKLKRGDSLFSIFDRQGRSVIDKNMNQREFIDKIYNYARLDQERYNQEVAAANDRMLRAQEAVIKLQGDEIVSDDPTVSGKIVTKRRAVKLDSEKFFDNATLLARFMGLLNPMITVMSGVDKAISYTLDDVLLNLGKQGRGPYKSFANGIEIKESTIREFCSDADVIDFMTALQMARYNGDLETFIARMLNNEITPKEYLAELDKQGNKLERAFRKVAKIATAEFMMRGKRAENFIRNLAKMSADEGHTWLAQKLVIGNEEMTELDRLLRGPDKVANLARLFYDPNAASDLVAHRALNLTLKADLAQDLAVSVFIETLIKRNGAINFGIAMACTPFLKANIAFAHRALGHVMPCCTINYLLATGLGQSKRLQKLNPNIEAEMDRARLYSSLREAAMVDVMNIGLGALAFMLAGCAFLEPPDDDDKWCNWEEWTLMGYRLDTEWWINDILGVALPIACFWKSALLGKATPQILMRGMKQVMMENPLVDVGELADLVTDPNGYMESLEESLEYYEDYPMGAPDGMEAVMATIPAIGLSWFGKLCTPSLFREIARLAPQYETSYNRIWEESPTGALTEEGAQGKTQKTTFLDSRIRKVTKNNPVLGFLLDISPIDSQTSYQGWKMPRQTIYDENQMNWMTEFSVVDEDGNPKSAEEQEQVVSEIILILQCTDDMDALYHDGFYLNSQTREACSKYIWDMYHELTNQWETWRSNGDLDFYVLGNGDFEAGSEKYGEMKLAYNQSRENLMSLYYDKLWSKELNQGLVVYNRYNTTWRQDINGNWYASGEQEKLGGLLSPLNKAPGTLEDPGITTGWAGDWGTPSAVTGQSMYDENGNAMRALVPTVENELDVPSLDSWGEDRNNGYSSNYGTVYNTGTTSNNNDNGSTGNTSGSTSYPNRGTSGTRRYSSGGGGGYGGGGSAPYSHVSAYGPNNNSIKQSAPNDGTRIYEANLDYLRPSFETKGSREAYRREDL